MTDYTICKLCGETAETCTYKGNKPIPLCFACQKKLADDFIASIREKHKNEKSNTTDIDEILNEREKTHGQFFEVSYTAQMLKHYCGNKYLPNVQAQAMDNINDKQARIKNGDHNFIDHWRDIAGYAMLVVRALERNKRLDDKVSCGRQSDYPGGSQGIYACDEEQKIGTVYTSPPSSPIKVGELMKNSDGVSHIRWHNHPDISSVEELLKKHKSDPKIFHTEDDTEMFCCHKEEKYSDPHIERMCEDLGIEEMKKENKGNSK